MGQANLKTMKSGSKRPTVEVKMPTMEVKS